MKIQRNVSSYNMKIENYKNIMKFQFSYKNNMSKHFPVLMLKIKACVLNSKITTLKIQNKREDK